MYIEAFRASTVVFAKLGLILMEDTVNITLYAEIIKGRH